MASLLHLTVLALVLTEVSCLPLSENIQDIIHTCVGSDITLPWTCRQDTIVAITWFFHGRSQERIAMLSHNMFVASPAFSKRLEHGSDGTLTIRHVTTEDSGNYTIEINGQDASGLAFTTRDSIFVHVAGEALMTSDHQLHVTQSPRAVYNDVTQEWSLQLSCGRFTYVGQPPLAVEWVSPSGGHYNSSSYGDGQYHWLVPNHVEEGSYTCLIPSRYVHVLCPPPGTSQGSEATLAVDSLKVRVMLMEAEQRSLKADNRQLSADNHRLAQNVLILQQDNLQLKGDNQRLGQDVSTLQQDNRQLWADNQRFTKNISSLQQRVMQFQAGSQQITTSSQDATRQQVSFYVGLSLNQERQFHDTLLLSTVFSNHGNAYNSTTGVFTAPYNATYFFIASTGSVDAQYDASMALVVDGAMLDRAYAHKADPLVGLATCHALVQLAEGQRVWLWSMGDSYFPGIFTYFSGFLIYS